MSTSFPANHRLVDKFEYGCGWSSFTKPIVSVNIENCGMAPTV
jgi:peptide methionine sulfoxide reductase MsrB